MKLHELIELRHPIPERVKYALDKCWELSNDKEFRAKKVEGADYPEKYLDKILPFFDAATLVAITESDKSISGFLGFILHDHGTSYDELVEGHPVIIVEYPFNTYYKAKMNVDANRRIQFPIYKKVDEMRKELVIQIPPDMSKLMSKYYDSIAELDYDEIGDERSFEAICRFFDCEGIIPYSMHYTGQSELGEGLCTVDNPHLIPSAGSMNTFYMMQHPKFDVAYLAYMDPKTEKFVVLKDVVD